MNRFSTELAERVAHNVRVIRERRGMTQEQLAEKAGLGSRSDISKYERMHQVPSLRVIEKLAHGLRVQPWDLLKEVVK